MQHLSQYIQDFVQHHCPDMVRIQALPADASNRVYYRVHVLPNRTFILMDAHKEIEIIAPYCGITNYLRSLGLHAPALLAVDEQRGLILMEDLGDMLVARLLEIEPHQEKEVYFLATDALVHLHNAPVLANLPRHDLNLLQSGLSLFIDWWVAPNIETELVEDSRKALMEIFTKLHMLGNPLEEVVVLRDYHAENLMLVPHSEGIERLGIIDFQDAVIGSPVYDLMSLLEDGRRYVSEEGAVAAITHYLAQRQHIDRAAFMQAYMVLGLQRNMRIIGVFNRLMQRDGKQKYMQFLPRKWHFVKYRLAHPMFVQLRQWFERYHVPIV